TWRGMRLQRPMQFRPPVQAQARADRIELAREKAIAKPEFSKPTPGFVSCAGAARPLRWTDINATVTTRRATAHDQQNRREGNMGQRNQAQGLRASALCIGIGFALGPMAAVAQEAPGEGGQATTLDRIEVTGSRIKRADIEGSLPI